MSKAEPYQDLADEFAADAAAFVAGVESVAAGTDPGSAISLILLGLSGILSSGANLGAQEDLGAPGEWLPSGPAEPGTASAPGDLGRALAEQFGPVDEYRELADPYVGSEVCAARLSDDLSDICGDLLQGLAFYTEGRAGDALAWWQYSYLANWGPSASACLRAVQSLMSLVRLGAPMGSPGDEAVI